MTKIQDLHQKWSADPEYLAEYQQLGEEFEIAKALIEARVSAGLTQAEVAKRMKTTQSVIARLEGGRSNPSTGTLEKFAAATGKKLQIRFV
ncbi:helix-turn-helix domain-containing protein [Synechococcus sp. PCC 7336]|uniref:helix-turn-helix domain-containing protein n=1 Tax=Synechococcus sp. PCC 7336 TaxID=195250 RepID=UPI00034A16E3|nr:helix-turn-helix transcriptional regulator [Synechococcus sp. PCC 7336]